MFVPSSPQLQTSPRARELGNKLVQTIREFRQSYPDTSARDLYQGMRVAEMELKSDFEGYLAQRKTALISVLIAVLVGLGFAMFFLSR